MITVLRSVRQALRDGTAQSHSALDTLWTGQDLADRDHYVRFLSASAAALLPIEAGLAVACVENVLPDWPLRRRADAIAADLAGFGLVPDVAAPAPIAPASVLGTLYVLEGSRLGATLLLRQVDASADPAVLANRRYLRHGQGGGLWRSFLQRLDGADPSRSELAEMIAAAGDAFARFDAAARASLA